MALMLVTLTSTEI